MVSDDPGVPGVAAAGTVAVCGVAGPARSLPGSADPVAVVGAPGAAAGAAGVTVGGGAAGLAGAAMSVGAPGGGAALPGDTPGLTNWLDGVPGRLAVSNVSGVFGGGVKLAKFPVVAGSVGMLGGAAVPAAPGAGPGAGEPAPGATSVDDGAGDDGNAVEGVVGAIFGLTVGRFRSGTFWPNSCAALALPMGLRADPTAPTPDVKADPTAPTPDAKAAPPRMSPSPVSTTAGAETNTSGSVTAAAPARSAGTDAATAGAAAEKNDETAAPVAANVSGTTDSPLASLKSQARRTNINDQRIIRHHNCLLIPRDHRPFTVKP